MKHYTPMISGDEYDALTRWRHSQGWKPGERRRIKRSYRRRERRVLNENPWRLDEDPVEWDEDPFIEWLYTDRTLTLRTFYCAARPTRRIGR
jgi:hypothetical protein